MQERLGQQAIFLGICQQEEENRKEKRRERIRRQSHSLTLRVRTTRPENNLKVQRPHSSYTGRSSASASSGRSVVEEVHV